MPGDRLTYRARCLLEDIVYRYPQGHLSAESWRRKFLGGVVGVIPRVVVVGAARCGGRVAFVENGSPRKGRPKRLHACMPRWTPRFNPELDGESQLQGMSPFDISPIF